MLALTATCVAAVLIAVWVRIGSSRSGTAGLAVRGGRAHDRDAARARDLHARRPASARLGAPCRDAAPRSLPKTFVPVASVSAARRRAARSTQSAASDSEDPVLGAAQRDGHTDSGARWRDRRPRAAPERRSARTAARPAGRRAARRRRAVDDRQPGRSARQRLAVGARGSDHLAAGRAVHRARVRLLGLAVDLHAILNIDSNTGDVTGTLSATRGRRMSAGLGETAAPRGAMSGVRAGGPARAAAAARRPRGRRCGDDARRPRARPRPAPARSRRAS